MIYYLIHIIIIIPILGFLSTLLIPKHKEKVISNTAFVFVFVNFIVALFLVIYWLLYGNSIINFKDYSFYKDEHYNFFLDFYFDKVSAVYLLVGYFITLLLVSYSRQYMKNEAGFKRFFNTLLFFYIGYTITVLSGNLETLYLGWEIIGITSFLLIAFYRFRYLPVKNAVKVFTVYRIGDVGLLMLMWMSHHLWDANVTFNDFNNFQLVEHNLHTHFNTGLFISLMILLAAIVKSAQFPFTFWLPRAMEGPTPSSAFFYGSLSVHIGAFLLLRTHHFWEHQLLMKYLIIFIGGITAIISISIARVQSTIKGQIGYSSVAQIGIIFIEIALGFEKLALFHFAGNAFLRTYQLLTSPSVVTYQIREQFYNFEKKPVKQTSAYVSKLRASIYFLSLKEWYLEIVFFYLVLYPLKKMRLLINFITLRNIVFILLPVYLFGVSLIYFELSFFKDIDDIHIARFYAFLAFLMVAKAFNEKSGSRLAWLLVVFAHFYIDLAVKFNDLHLSFIETLIYLNGIYISGIIGLICLQYVRWKEKKSIGLKKYHGLAEKYPKTAFIFLLSTLGIMGFPITSSFLGEDLILSHIHEHQIILVSLVSLSYIFIGITVIRIFAKIFLGEISNNIQNKIELSI